MSKAFLQLILFIYIFNYLIFIYEMIKLTELLDTKNTAGVCILHIGRNVLLIKKTDSGEWEIPKGHIRTGETTLEGALRETFEETQIAIKGPLKKVHKGKNKEGGDFCIFRYDIEEQIVPVLSDEHSEYIYL